MNEDILLLSVPLFFHFRLADQIHKEIGGTVIRRFVNQELAKSGKISAQGVSFLANINTRLAMPGDVSILS